MRSKPEQITSRAVPLYYNSYKRSYGTDVWIRQIKAIKNSPKFSPASILVDV